MARQKGILKVIGTLDGVNYYPIKGVIYARRAGGGFNGEAIRTKPSMQRVRENANEFGQCSRVKKAFRLALMTFLYGYRDNQLHARMMTLFTGIKKLDGVSVRGERRVGVGLETAKGRRLLRDFAFTPQNTMLDGLKSRAHFDWNTQVLTVTDYKPKSYKLPQAATHIGITMGVLDFDFDSLDSVLRVSSTHFLEVGSGGATFDLAPETVVVPEHVGVVVLGLRFYELIEDELYGLESQIGVGLLDVKI